jgi:signal transduction histidine kinase/ActR/RegA family two-component response regulator
VADVPAAHVHQALAHWVTNLANHGIVATDGDLRVTAWNEWMDAHSGRPAESVIGQPLVGLFPDLASRGIDSYYRRALAGEVSLISYGLHRYIFPLRPTLHDLGLSHMPQSARVGPLVHEGTVIGTVTLVDDVSDRLATEAELRRQIEAQQRARQAAERALRAKDDFLSTLSHEIRQPLNAVLGWTRILRGRTERDPDLVARALEIIDRNASVQASMIDDLLDMARIVAGKLRLDLQPVDLVPLTVAAIDVVAPAARAKDVTLHTDLGTGVTQVLGDPARLQQVVWNLLSNAVKFTPAGGSVAVHVSSQKRQARVVVRDTGLGIDPDLLPHVFDRFRQGDASSARREGGLGLGLALVRDLVELHGGTVAVESNGPGQGATFSVHLPTMATHDWDHAPPPTLTSDHAARLDGVRVMVLDDEADTRDLVVMTLRQCGADVTAASSCADAIGLITQASEDGRPHVVVSDIGMPGEDGYSFIRRLRAIEIDSRRIRAVALTGYANDEDRTRVLAAGFQAHVPKPTDPSAVVAAVIEALRADA